MRRLILMALVLAFSATSADARRRHHHYRMHRAPVMMVVPPPMESVRGARARDDTNFIPAGWALQPADPKFSGRRYMAPDGSAWLALYSVQADRDALAAHLKNVAFADGEEVTYLRGARDWLAVTGFKGDRVYYRKVVLSCGGTTWRHIAFDYPAQAKPVIDRMVERASRVFDRLAEDSCGGDMFTHP